MSFESGVAGAVSTVETTSTSFMTGAGLKKRPATLGGVPRRGRERGYRQ